MTTDFTKEFVKQLKNQDFEYGVLLESRENIAQSARVYVIISK